MYQRTKIAVAVTLAVSAMSAFAQTATTEAPLQRVEVTGSRIRAVDLATAQPIQIMSQEQIQKSGLVTVGDILNTLSSSAIARVEERIVRSIWLTKKRSNSTAAWVALAT